MKIAITGSNGRVGGALANFFRRAGHDVVALTRNDVPLDQPALLREAVRSLDVDAWINPAAVSSPDACERDPITSHAVNAVAPAIMADACRQSDRYMLHFSTDYVFSGNEPGKREEQDIAEPINAYGAHKREGELAVLASGARATVLRVSWVYGANIPAFVEQCLQRLSAGADIDAIDDKWSIPTAMPDLCEWTDQLLQQQPSAVLHGCHGGAPVSWHGIATHLRDVHMPDSTSDIQATSLAGAAHFIARRPVHTAMDHQVLCSMLPRPIEDWRTAMARIINSR
ncbi:MAG: hypothetical protein RI957_1517 [Verrucomicrobiota bacterium]